MTTLVHESSGHLSSSNPYALKAHLAADMKFAQRKATPILESSKKDREQFFYILDIDAPRPDEFRRGRFRYVKESAVHLPPTDESLQKIARAFEEHSIECSYGCKFSQLSIKECAQKGNSDSFIFYVITAPIDDHHRH